MSATPPPQEKRENGGFRTWRNSRSHGKLPYRKDQRRDPNETETGDEIKYRVVEPKAGPRAGFITGIMKGIFRTVIRPLLWRLGIDIVRHRKPGPAACTYPPDFSERSVEICDLVRPYTMTSPERVDALVGAVHYVVTNDIPGALVECGVWKGGSVMAMALLLQKLGVQNRDLYLYDTFSGMTAPKDVDISARGKRASEEFLKSKTCEDASEWCRAPLEEVKENLFGTGYPKERLHFVEGKVEDTLPKASPASIALLRLDTDWYESTRHILTHLFPVLSHNGVIIIDDYGYWAGARKAVDEYFDDTRTRILLNRIDGTGRIGLRT